MSDNTAIPAQSSPRKIDMRKLDTDIYNILTQFEKTREWADLTNCLIKLNRIVSNSSITHIPYKETICKRLAQCLNHQLPIGVHSRALEVYASILEKTPPENLAKDLALYSTGLFPFFSYSSLSIRPQFLEIIDRYYIPLGKKLMPCLNGLLICILPGLEDEKSETYDMVYKMVEKISDCVSEKYFMRSLWLILKRASKIRIITLYVISNKLSPGVPHLPKERLEMLLPDLNSVVVESLLAATLDESIISLRELTNFVHKHFPLHTDIINYEDKVSLCRNFLSLLRKKDWSLTRRIYQWLFNSVDLNETMESMDLTYFTEHSKTVIIMAVKELLNAGCLTTEEAVIPLKIIVTLISDIEVAVIAEELMPVLCIPIMKYVCDGIEDPDWRHPIIQESKIIFNPNLTEPKIVFNAIIEEFNKIFLDYTYNSMHAWNDILDLLGTYLDEMKTLTICEMVLKGLFMLMENALQKLMQFQVKSQPQISLYIMRYISSILGRIETIIKGEYQDSVLETEITLKEDFNKAKELEQSQKSCNERIYKYLDHFYIKSLTYFDQKQTLTNNQETVLDMLDNLLVRFVSIEEMMKKYPITDEIRKIKERKYSEELWEIDENEEEISLSEVKLEGWTVCLLKCCLSKNAVLFCRGIRTFIQVINLPDKKSLKRFFSETKIHMTNIILQLWNSLDEKYSTYHSEIVLLLLNLMYSVPESEEETEKLIVKDLKNAEVEIKINSILRFGVLFRYLHVHAPDQVFFPEAVGYILDSLEETEPKVHYYTRAFLSESIYMLPNLLNPILLYLLKFDTRSIGSDRPKRGEQDDGRFRRWSSMGVRSPMDDDSMIMRSVNTLGKCKTMMPNYPVKRIQSYKEEAAPAKEVGLEDKNVMKEVARRFRHLCSIVGREGQGLMELMQKRQVPIELLKLIQGEQLYSQMSNQVPNELEMVTSTSLSEEENETNQTEEEIELKKEAKLVKFIYKSAFETQQITIDSSLLETPNSTPKTKTSNLETKSEASATSERRPLKKVRSEEVYKDNEKLSTNASLKRLSEKSKLHSPVMEMNRGIQGRSWQKYLNKEDRKCGTMEEVTKVGQGCQVFPRLSDPSNQSYTDESIYNYMDLLIVLTLKYICLDLDLEILEKIETKQDVMDYQKLFKRNKNKEGEVKGEKENKLSATIRKLQNKGEKTEEDTKILMRCTAIDFMKLFLSSINPASTAREVSCLISKYILLVLYHFHLMDEHIIQTQLIYLLKVVMDRCNQEVTKMSKGLVSLLDLSNTLLKDLENKYKSPSNKMASATPKMKSRFSKSTQMTTIVDLSPNSTETPNSVTLDDMEENHFNKLLSIDHLCSTYYSKQYQIGKDFIKNFPVDIDKMLSYLSPVYIINVASIKKKQVENMVKLSEIKYFPKIIQICVRNSANMMCQHLLQSYIDFSIYNLKYLKGPEAVMYTSKLIMEFATDMENYKEKIGTTGIFYYLRALYFMFGHLSENYKLMKENENKANMQEEQGWHSLFGNLSKQKKKSMVETYGFPPLDLRHMLKATIVCLLWAKGQEIKMKPNKEEHYKYYDKKEFNYEDLLNTEDSESGYDSSVDVETIKSMEREEVKFDEKETLEKTRHGYRCSEVNVPLRVSFDMITTQAVRLFRIAYLKSPHRFIKGCIKLWDRSNTEEKTANIEELNTTVSNLEDYCRNETKNLILMIFGRIPHLKTDKILSHVLDMLETYCKSPQFKQLKGYLVLNSEVRENSVSEFMYTVTTSNLIRQGDVYETYSQLQRWIHLILHYPKEPTVFLWIFHTLVKYEKITTFNSSKVLNNVGKKLFNDLLMVIIYQACGIYSDKVCHWLPKKDYDVNPPVPLQITLINSGYYSSNRPLTQTIHSTTYIYTKLSPIMSPKRGKEDEFKNSLSEKSESLNESQEEISKSLSEQFTKSISIKEGRQNSIVTEQLSIRTSRTSSFTGMEMFNKGYESPDGKSNNQVVSENALSMLIFFNYEVLQLNRRTPITNVLFQTMQKSLTTYILPLLLCRQSPQEWYFTLLLVRYLPYSLYEVPLNNIKKNILEYINSPDFFKIDKYSLKVLIDLFRQIANEDCRGVTDLVSKLDSYTNPQHMNVFSNKSVNLMSRLKYLNRLAFVLYACEHDMFSRNISNIIERLAETTRSFKNDTVRAKCLFVMRVLLVKTSQEHLAVLWPVLLSELIKVFKMGMEAGNELLMYPNQTNSDHESTQNSTPPTPSSVPNKEEQNSQDTILRDDRSSRSSSDRASKYLEKIPRSSNRNSSRYSEKSSSRMSERGSGRTSDKEGLKMIENPECPGSNSYALLMEAINIVDVACALRMYEFLVYQWMFINDLTYSRSIDSQSSLSSLNDISSNELKRQYSGEQGESEEKKHESEEFQEEGNTEEEGLKNFKPFLMILHEMYTDEIRDQINNLISRSTERSKLLKKKNLKNNHQNERNILNTLKESIENEMIRGNTVQGQLKPININQIYKIFKKYH